MSYAGRRRRQTESEAWQRYCETGLIDPEYSGEIAARRRIAREWAEIGKPIQ